MPPVSSPPSTKPQRTARELSIPVIAAAFVTLACALFPSIAHAQSGGAPSDLPHAFDLVLEQIKSLTGGWRGNITGPALGLFATLITVQGITIGAQLAFPHAQPHWNKSSNVTSRALKFLIFAAVGFFLIDNTSTLVDTLYTTVLQAAAIVTGEPISSFATPSEIGFMQFDMMWQLWSMVGDTGAFGMLLSAIRGTLDEEIAMITLGAVLIFITNTVIFAAYGGMILQVGITQIIYFITAALAPFFLAFAGWSRTAGIAEGFLRLLVYVCVRLFAVFIILRFVVEFPAEIMDAYNFGSYNQYDKYVVMLHCCLSGLAGSLVAVAAVWVIPITLARMVTQRLSFDLEGLVSW